MERWKTSSSHSTASINTLASPLGGILSATVLDQLGRKFTLVLINIFSIIAWSLLYFSSTTNFDAMYWQIMLGRFFIGKRSLWLVMCENYITLLSFLTISILNARCNNWLEQFTSSRYEEGANKFNFSETLIFLSPPSPWLKQFTRRK